MVAIALAASGLYSAFAMNLCAKLLARMSLEWWDFEASTLPFFLHHIAILGLYACLAHYGFQWLQRGQDRRIPGTRSAPRALGPHQ